MTPLSLLAQLATPTTSDPGFLTGLVEHLPRDPLSLFALALLAGGIAWVIQGSRPKRPRPPSTPT